MTDLSRLKEAALKATKGIWMQSMLQPLYVISDDSSYVVCSLAEFEENGDVNHFYSGSASQAGEDCRFIALANPSTILDLIAKIEELQGKPTHYHQAKRVDGELVRECDACGKDLMDESHIRHRVVALPEKEEV